MEQCGGAASKSVGGVVGVLNVPMNPTAIGDCMAVGFSLGADFSGVGVMPGVRALVLRTPTVRVASRSAAA